MKVHFLKLLSFIAMVLFMSACGSSPSTTNGTAKDSIKSLSATPVVDATCKKILYVYHQPLSGLGRPANNLVAGCPFDSERRILASDTLSAAWSPGGGEIVFLSTQSGTGQLYLMLPDGSNVRQLTFGPDLLNSEWVWLPDGKRIALLYRLPYGGIDEEDEDRGAGETPEQSTKEPFEPIWQALDLTSLELSPLRGWTAEALFDYRPVLAHDRTRLAFEVYAEEVDGYQIYLQNLDGSETTPLIIDIPSGNATWFPDDRRLAFWVDLSGKREQFAIFAINVDGTGFTRLSEHTFGTWPNFLISPDATALVISDGTTVYLLEFETDTLTMLFSLEYPNTVTPVSWQP